jgi:hypothetical protein
MSGLTGTHRVRVIRPAFHDVGRLCERTVDKIEIRRHALKLRYWPAMHPTDDRGQLLDLDWSWIRAMEGMNVGELRIHDSIGGNDNLRIIFYEGDPKVCEPLPMIWVLQVLQKKRDEFTRANLATFKARRLLVRERFYKYRV